MQLKQLEAFQAVAQSQSFSAAAKTTKLSQPTLSRLIKQLESEIGAELIDRYHRPLQLTEAGAFFYEKTKLLLADLDTLTAMTARMANPPKTLSIGFVPSVLYGLLPDVIAWLKQKTPSLEIQLKDIPSYQQFEALKLGNIDVGFGRFAQQDPWIRQILLRHERYVVALPYQHPLASCSDLRLSQLSDNRLILYHQTHLDHIPANGISEPLLNMFARHGATPFSTTAVSDLQVALGLVAAGEGITLVPDSLKTLRSEQIHYQRLIHEDATSPIYLNTLAETSHPALAILLESIYQIYEHKGFTYRRTGE